MKISRDAEKELKQLIKEYPVVTVLGPRQAGKTTLVREVLKSYQYSNLEHPETREFAQKDPKAFLAQFTENVILDEIQRVPELLSYVQVMVDERKKLGRFVLTGSHQLNLHAAISQSLAGRTAILNLLPLSLSELQKANFKYSHFNEYCFKGFLPRIYDDNLRPTTAYSNYYQTYVERDVRQIINLRNTSLFEKFMKLIAGRVGQIFEANSLANDVGVDSKTIKNWISILEASFILFKLPPYFENFGKRAIKSPKYYFTDVGLLVYLLGIESKTQINRDPLVGNIFENLVVIDCLKERYNKGKRANLYFFRDSNGNEIDILYQESREQLVAIEVKSSSTYSSKLIKGIQKFKETNLKTTKSFLVYSGSNKSLSNEIKALNFSELSKIFSD